MLTRGPVTVDVKRLPKREAPKKFGRRLSAAQKERATHICLDCGYIYCLPTPWAETGSDYLCPQCNAPKKRFRKYDAETGKILGDTSAPVVATVAGLASAVAIGALVFVGLQ